MNHLIENCYNNKYKIDLKKIHIEASKSANNRTQSTIYDSKFNRYNFVFEDGISTHFELIYHNNLIYLLGNKSCYPCGRIVESIYEINWVPIFVVPTGKTIKTSSDIRKTCCVNIDPINSFLPYLTLSNFQDFTEDYQNSFKSNNWYDHNQLRILINSYNLTSVKETFNELRKRNLLNPFELALGSIIYDFSITSTEVFNCLNYAKNISPQFTYVEYFKTKFSLSVSTSQLIRTEDFKKFIDSFDINEIEQFFEIRYLIENIKFDNFYSELMADILQIKILDRLCPINSFSNPAKILQARFDMINLTQTLVKEFYNKIKSNIRSIENQVRINKGYKEVGSLYNEIIILENIQKCFSEYDVVSQYSPDWLGRQRFDVFIKDLNIAIEYNGKQHYEPINYFGGIDGFNDIVRRDEQKRKKCKENNCLLLEIKYDEKIDIALSNINDKINCIINSG